MPKKDFPRIVSLEIARLLRDERTRQGLSMTEVANRAGLSQQMVSYVERGMRNPTVDTLLRITPVLKTDLWKLIQRASTAAKRRVS